jgi:hypothetical protein
MLQIFVGIIGIVFGFVLIWKSNWIVENLGRVSWAEQHLGTEGGTRLLYKLIGLLIIFFSFMLMFGILGGIITTVFSPITSSL